MARILVIEDNAVNMELMRYLLGAFGHTVLTAADGIEGLDAARRELPELIICDVQLPKADGYEVARRLKADIGLKGIPVIAVTALAMVGDRDKGMAAGFDGYIPKPLEPESFVGEVERFLRTEKRGEAPARPPTQESARPGRSHATRASILIVDDSPVNRDVLHDMLEPFGYEIRTAASVAEGLECARQTPPDLVLSDLHMPDQNGFALIRQLKSVPQLAAVPIMIVSSTAWSTTDRMMAQQFGAVRFFLRPFEPQALLDEIAACLEHGKE
jgi:two-component system cell cycle response regulator